MIARVWHCRCHYSRQESPAKPAGIQNLDFGSQEFLMFDAKNNRILDSLSFRLAVTVAVFAVWFGAGYVLLSLA
jgi:hypothetical protein